MRVYETHRPEKINWDQFLSFFCRRKMLREGEVPTFNYNDPRGCASNDVTFQNKANLMDELMGGLQDDDPEALKEKLQSKLAHITTDKQNKVPRSGKGKYNVTVPVLYRFQKHKPEGTTLRQQWLEGEVERIEQEAQKEMNTRSKPTPVPRSNSKNLHLFEKLNDRNELRRQKSKEASLAKNRTLS